MVCGVQDGRVRSAALAAVAAGSCSLRCMPRLLHPHLHTLWPLMCRRLKDPWPPLRLQVPPSPLVSSLSLSCVGELLEVWPGVDTTTSATRERAVQKG